MAPSNDLRLARLGMYPRLARLYARHPFLANDWCSEPARSMLTRLRESVGWDTQSR